MIGKGKAYGDLYILEDKTESVVARKQNVILVADGDID